MPAALSALTPSIWTARDYRQFARELDIWAKRKADSYAPGTGWFKVKNPKYCHAEGRGDLFNRARRE
jgi:hypothetical protein